MIKLFVTDLDGTLLGDNHAVSKKNAQAIRDLKAAGIEFMVATGRSYDSAIAVLKPHDIQCQMINLNGAISYDINGNILQSIPLKLNTVSDIFDYVALNEMNFSIMTQDTFYTSDKDKFIERMETLLRQAAESSEEEEDSNIQFFGETVEDIDDYELTTENPPLKVMLISQDPKVLTDFKATFDSYPDIDITSSAPDNLEITSHRAQKGLAVQEYINSSGYTMDDVATIGDSLNDRSMLRMARYGFAMENASDEVKDIARYKAPSNEEDGVAQIIYRFLENNFD